MGTDIAGARDTMADSRMIPTTGMRGGLGRILLTAFLILTILPLTLTGGYAAQQNRQNLQLEVEKRLLTIALLKGAALQQYFDQWQARLLSSIELESGRASSSRELWWSTLQKLNPDLVGVTILSSDGVFIEHLGAHSELSSQSQRVFQAEPYLPKNLTVSYFDTFVLFPVAHDDQVFVFYLTSSVVSRIIQRDFPVEETTQIYFVYRQCVWPQGEVCVREALIALSQNKQGSSGAYVNHNEVLVSGAYYALPDIAGGILVEQEQAEILSSTDRIATTLIALILAVAFVTTAIAAVFIRQITRPVILLTESAVAMAEGDLDQHLSVKSRDEIGILTYVFNEMADELKSLYEDLEAKVIERTKRLQRANYQIQRRAIHLETSQEVSQAITSIRDPSILLNRVVDLIRDRFMYASVSIYMVEPGGGKACLRALSPKVSELDNSSVDESSGWVDYFYAGDGSVVDRAIRKRLPQVDSQQTAEEVEWYRRTLSRIAVPLRMEERVSGALAALSTEREGIQADELEVLEILANQVSIALENARAYERERLATQQLENAEAFKVNFLMNMSHDLREPLNTIIGFSRLMIKGVDGPLNQQQLQDLEQIYEDGQHLLFLINDILTISQIQAGLMELKLQPVNLEEVVTGVMPTASALVRGKNIELVQDIPKDLPFLRADPIRLRQVLVHLFNNAAKFTESGMIMLRAWHDEDNVYVSVQDTGVGIPWEDRERIFYSFEKGPVHQVQQRQGVGLGLALSKEFIEMHGGQIWMESGVGRGSTFTFSLPFYVEESRDEGEV